MHAYYYLLLSDLTTKTTANNFSSHFLHTYTYTTLQNNHLYSSDEENSQNKRANLDGRQLDNFDYRKLAIISSLYTKYR